MTNRTNKRRRIIYGVHGYGRGHASRAQAILPYLTEKYDVLVLAGDDAYDQLHRDWSVRRIPVLRYYHGSNGRRSPLRTISRNIPAVLDQLMMGPGLGMVCDEIERFAPDVILSDSEGWTHRAGRRLGVPRISFDHFGVLVYCRLDLNGMDSLTQGFEAMLYKALVCDPQRAIAVAFFDGPCARDDVTVVGPVIRREAREMKPRAGEHLLVYFANADAHFTPAVEQALRSLEVPVKVYHPSRRGGEGNLSFHPPSNVPFLEDLAGCRGVLSTAGNQLCSEAIHLGKPLLLTPEDALEQRLNAQVVQRWEIGQYAKAREIEDPEYLRGFLDRADEYAANIPAHRRDGLDEALSAIDRDIEELCGGAGKPAD